MTALADAHPARRQRRALLLLAVPVLLFGITWPVSKVALQDATPLWFAADRAILSTGAAFALVIVLRQWRRPTREDLPIILSVGILQLAAYFALTGLGLSFVPAGRSVVLSSITTLWLVPLALLTGEPIPPLRWLGVAAGLIGIITLANPWSLDWREPGIAIGHGVLVLAALCWALAIRHAGRHAWHLSPLQALLWQMLVASALLVPLAALADPRGGVGRTLPALGGLFYVGVIAGPLATWAAVIVARDLPSVVSSLGFLGIPALGLILSTTLLGESMTWSLALGSALIGCGVALAILARPTPAHS
jgi:drug/metabolite transporter (DMT)-like permease